MAKILLVDDDLQALESTKKILEYSEHEVVVATDGQSALQIVRSTNAGTQPFELVITDVRMPRLGGLEFLKALGVCGQSIPVILMTAYGRVEDAVWAMKLGAVDFLTKPFKRQTLVSAIDSVLKRSRSVAGSSSLLGTSDKMIQLKALIEQVAPTSATVLVMGESGTGKELVARCIYEKSNRSKNSFIALNCAALPEQLIESELFGYEKGAFTGAVGAKQGLFAAADRGTLLLDEIGDLPLSVQSKLLRVLQEGEVRRIGSTKSEKVDVRVIAATNRNLSEAAKQGRFREDLLFRLEVIIIQVPPLRERAEDIAEIANHFLVLANKRHSKNVSGIDEEAMSFLRRHNWPGNVRELSNVIERAVVFASSEVITKNSLPLHISNLTDSTSVRHGTVSVTIGTPLDEIEELLIRKTLEATSGDKNMTAKLLGVNPRTIYRKLEKN